MQWNIFSALCNPTYEVDKRLPSLEIGRKKHQTKLSSKDPNASTYRAIVNIQEFESQYQESVSQILNELQSMAIISNRLESNIVEVGVAVQSLNQMVETFLRQQSDRPRSSN